MMSHPFFKKNAIKLLNTIGADFSGSTQVTTVLQHTSIALTFLVISTAQYVGRVAQSV
jgi:hypothetical protein